MSSYQVNPIDRLKSGSTISLQGHDPKNIDLLRPRSSTMLSARGPALPALPFDVSVELAKDNAERRRLHSAVLSENPGAFRRQQKPESASAFVHTMNLNKNLLEGMHSLKDPKDIDKNKNFTRSILFEKQEKERQELERYHFEHMAPLEDFIRPDDQTSQRQTGYADGHIRSMLKLDTYGPAGSASVLKGRSTGQLPPSPNLDRHAIVSPQYPLRPSKTPVHVPAGSAESVASNNSIPTMSDDSCSHYTGAFPSLRAFRKSMSIDHQERSHAGVSPTAASAGSSASSRRHSTNANGNQHDYVIQDLFHPSSATLTNDPPDSRGRSPSVRISSPSTTSFAGPILSPPGSRSGLRSASSNFGSRGSARFPDQTFAGKAITEKERILKDPFLRRGAWFKSYEKRVENEKASKQYRKQKMQYRKEQQELARSERDVIKDFENHLVLAIYEP